MASESGTEDTPLELEPEQDDNNRAALVHVADPRSKYRYNAVRELIETVPYEFKFFQLVRLLERLNPERSQVGGFVPPSRDQNLAFPASQVQGVEFQEDRSPTVIVNFFGLTGPMGVLPHYYTELIRDRLRVRDKTMASFFDMFNHRMVSLFYLAWDKYRFAIAYERGERDRFSHILMDIIGIGTPGLQDRQRVADDSLLFYSGLLAMHTRPAAGLRQILWDYFDVEVEIEQLVGAWYPLDIPNQCKFDRANSVSEQMGVGAIVGDEIWDQQSGVLIRLGPLTLRQYLDFLPTGSAYAPLMAILRFYAGWEIDFQIQLVLKREETPPCELGATGDASPLLGWVSWSKNRDMDRDPDDTVLRV
jgi:type VI secretion system protein ImpH